jgi:hypothetical protein
LQTLNFALRAGAQVQVDSVLSCIGRPGDSRHCSRPDRIGSSALVLALALVARLSPNFGCSFGYWLAAPTVLLRVDALSLANEERSAVTAR